MLVWVDDCETGDADCLPLASLDGVVLDFVVGPGRTNDGDPTAPDPSRSRSFPLTVPGVVLCEDPIPLKKSLNPPLELVPPAPDPSTGPLTCRPRNVVGAGGALLVEEGDPVGRDVEAVEVMLGVVDGCIS